jgi:hypothetical protein
MLTFILAAVLTAIPAYFIWTALHELAHYLMASRFRETSNVKFKLYPHKDPGQDFVWASVEYTLTSALSPIETTAVMLAPRILGFVALCLLPLSALFPFMWLQAVWMVFWGAGLVDMAWGSIGYTATSDLQRAAKSMRWNPWFLRILGWSLVLVSFAIMIVVFVI